MISFPFLRGLAPGAPGSSLATILDPFLATGLDHSEIIALFTIGGGLIIAAVIIIAVLYFQHQKQRLWHETARLAIERGQPLPPYPATDEERESQPPPGVSPDQWKRSRCGGSFKGSLILIAIGIGIGFVSGRNYFAGAIPFLIGVALLINGLLERYWSRGPSGPRPRA
jgi:hypothetical protein